MRKATFLFDAAILFALLLPISARADVGDLFEADAGSGTIFKFTSGGAKTTFAAGLNNPVGLAVDAVGNLFEADFNSDTIFKFTPDGTKITFAWCSAASSRGSR